MADLRVTYINFTYFYASQKYLTVFLKHDKFVSNDFFLSVDTPHLFKKIRKLTSGILYNV